VGRLGLGSLSVVRSQAPASVGRLGSLSVVRSQAPASVGRLSPRADTEPSGASPAHGPLSPPGSGFRC